VESLTALFSRYAGFKEVRTVPGRTNIAFVEYENEQSAIDAKQQTGALVLGDNTIKVTYQRQ
jgi:U2 small nuclear ribonucleoprotein B''